MSADLFFLARKRFPALVFAVQVPPATALVFWLSVQHPYYRVFPVLLAFFSWLFWFPVFHGKWFRFLPALSYFGLISMLSSTTTVTRRRVSGFLFHPVEYFFLALLVAWALSRFKPLRITIPVTLTLCVLAGILDEWHQSFVPGRVADFMDVILDMTGAAVGCLAFTIFTLHPRHKEFPCDCTNVHTTP